MDFVQVAKISNRKRLKWSGTAKRVMWRETTMATGVKSLAKRAITSLVSDLAVVC